MQSPIAKTVGSMNIAAARVLALLVLFDVPCLRSQSSQATDAQSPLFEVASIKLNTSGSGSSHGSSDPGSYFGTNGRLKDLIREAYSMNGKRLEDSQIVDCPGWAIAKRYDVDAKMDNPTTEAIKKLPEAEQRDQMNRALQALLADRFKLKVKQGATEIPVFALVIAKGGPKLTKTAPMARSGEHIDQRSGGINALATLDTLAQTLGRMRTFSDRPVINQTGLTDRYEMNLHFSSSAAAVLPGPDGDPSVDSSSDSPSIFTALEEQLGLRIESTKAPVYTVTIEQIEEPSPN